MGVATTHCPATARDDLLARYEAVVAVNADLNRSLVSFQANKEEPFYRWFKYKEGFSARLVEYLLARLAGKPGVLLDPFAGSGAALFAAREHGWAAIGIELLPVGFFAMSVREAAEHVNPADLREQIRTVQRLSFSDYSDEEHAFKHIRITDGAFPPGTEEQVSGWLGYCDKEVVPPALRKLLRFACFAVLEEVSYTRKDGQYLRWDARCGRDRVNGDFDKGPIPPFREALLREMRKIADDLGNSGWLLGPAHTTRGALDLRRGSCLTILPDMPRSSVNLVITSPPYCNRYDYTRTYALELAFLGYDDEGVKRLRQEMLSCTVENKEKKNELRELFSTKRRSGDFHRVDNAFLEQSALQEVLAALEECRIAGRLNNPNVVRMVHNYFYEMAFVIHELARVLKPGGKVVMVNDNVRYAGQEVPVDLVLSDFARLFGLSVRHIWVLPRGKGNSSQQMGEHGRHELRKCVYVWEKPR